MASNEKMLMGTDTISHYFEQLRASRVKNGGFAHKPGGTYRPDATAWAILAFRSAEMSSEAISAQKCLTTSQLKDGRVSVSPDHAEAFWPTALAVLAWHGSDACRQAQSRAIAFLLSTTGTYWPKRPGSPVAHDTSIKGWPWTQDTHAWVQPTSLAIMALQAAGYSAHERVVEGKRMLLDRQLPEGGWNYGNTLVFGKALRPLPTSTAMALHALANAAPREAVDRSLRYMKHSVKTIRSPLSLSWTILGLSAWAMRPPTAEDWIMQSLERQKYYGPYDTAVLAMALVAFHQTSGLRSKKG